MATLCNKKRSRRLSRTEVFDQKEDTELNITSLMDMFTIMLLFLLHSFSSTPEIVNQSDELRLPVSTLISQPESSTAITVSKSTILVNDEPIAEVTSDWTVSSRQLSQQGRAIRPLVAALKKAMVHGKKWEKESGKKFIPELLIKAHGEMDYTLLQKVLFSGAFAGFNGYRLLVTQG